MENETSNCTPRKTRIETRKTRSYYVAVSVLPIVLHEKLGLKLAAKAKVFQNINTSNCTPRKTRIET